MKLYKATELELIWQYFEMLKSFGKLSYNYVEEGIPMGKTSKSEVVTMELLQQLIELDAITLYYRHQRNSNLNKQGIFRYSFRININKTEKSSHLITRPYEYISSEVCEVTIYDKHLHSHLKRGPGPRGYL